MAAAFASSRFTSASASARESHTSTTRPSSDVTQYTFSIFMPTKITRKGVLVPCSGNTQSSPALRLPVLFTGYFGAGDFVPQSTYPAYVRAFVWLYTRSVVATLAWPSSALTA